MNISLTKLPKYWISYNFFHGHLLTQSICKYNRYYGKYCDNKSSNYRIQCIRKNLIAYLCQVNMHNMQKKQQMYNLEHHFSFKETNSNAHFELLGYNKSRCDWNRHSASYLDYTLSVYLKSSAALRQICNELSESPVAKIKCKFLLKIFFFFLSKSWH